jgi:hypothetical protein
MDGLYDSGDDWNDLLAANPLDVIEDPILLFRTREYVNSTEQRHVPSCRLGACHAVWSESHDEQFGSRTGASELILSGPHRRPTCVRASNLNEL